MLMTQHNMTQTLLKGHVNATCPCFADDRFSHGHEPEKTKEIISQEEANKRKTEKFLKQIHLPKQVTLKDISEGPSNEDFPPLPPPASPQVDRPPQQAPITKSGSYKATLLKEKPDIQLHGGKPQRAQKQNQKEHPRVKPYASVKTTPKIKTQTAQGLIVLPGCPQTGQSSLSRCSHLPMFAQFQKAEEEIIPKDHTFKGKCGIDIRQSLHRAHPPCLTLIQN